MTGIEPLKRKEVLTFTTTWVEPEGIMLSETEVRKRKTNVI